MKVKIDTKENFRIFKVDGPDLYANLADELKDILLDGLKEPPYNAILQVDPPVELTAEAFQVILAVSQVYQTQNASFLVVGGIWPGAFKEKNDISMDEVAFVPTLIEAVDLIIMEILERELLNEEPKQGRPRPSGENQPH